MKKYSENSIYISSYAKLPSEIPSGGMYKSIDIGLIINMETHVIEGVSITLVTEEAKCFLSQILEGYCMDDGIEPLIEIIKKKYFGSSQKAVCVTLKLVYEKYLSKIEEMK